MDYIYLFVVPIVVSLILATMPVLWTNSRIIGLGLLVVTIDMILFVLRHHSLPYNFTAQIILFAVFPSLTLVIAALLLMRMKRMKLIIAIGPMTYWGGFVCGVNIWLKLGYPI
jgi:hypothetical protein